MLLSTSFTQALGNSRAFTAESTPFDGLSFYHLGTKIAQIGEKGLWVSLGGFDKDPAVDTYSRVLYARLNRLIEPYNVQVISKDCRAVLCLSCDSEIRMDPNEWYFLNDSRRRGSK